MQRILNRMSRGLGKVEREREREKEMRGGTSTQAKGDINFVYLSRRSVTLSSLTLRP